MTLEQQRIKIATALGWEFFPSFDTWNGISPEYWHHKESELTAYDSSELPDYLGDLNAMHSAEHSGVIKHLPDYLHHLRKVVSQFPESMSDWDDWYWWDVVHATAAQRAEAFLRTLNLWEE